MKTQVQTYLIEETEELIYDGEKLREWERLINELDLEGQTKIQNPEKSPIPYLCLNETQENIIKTLCPRSEGIKEYNSTPIPFELLTLVAFSIKEKHFKKIEVWYDEKDKCPAIVGFTGYYSEYSWYSDSNKSLEGQKFDTKQEGIEAGGKHIDFRIDKKYLLGRWADIKEDFKQLAIRAKERFILTRKNEINQQIKIYQRDLEDLENSAFKLFGI